jgi:Cu-Zn family superoxide dismutase
MTHSRIALVASLALAAACGGGEEAELEPIAEGPGVAPEAGAVDPTMPVGGAAGGATAVLRDASGSEVGTLTLTETGQTIQVSGTLRGLPAGTHAIHLHQTGQCQAPTFESAGGHWNPTNRQHGIEHPQGPHLGDMPNIEVGQDGTVNVQVSTVNAQAPTPQEATLTGANGLMDADGAAVVVHAQADDYESQPSGAAGDRIACGVVNAS